MDQNEMFNQNNFMYTITPYEIDGIKSAVKKSWDMKSAAQSLENYLSNQDDISITTESELCESDTSYQFETFECNPMDSV